MLVAEQFLKELGYGTHYIIDVMNYIRYTKHRDTPPTLDGKILNDLDMKILASDEKTFSTYDQNIRKERLHYDDNDYKKGRISFLKEMAGKKIFHILTDYEPYAKANIKSTLEKLQ